MNSKWFLSCDQLRQLDFLAMRILNNYLFLKRVADFIINWTDTFVCSVVKKRQKMWNKFVLNMFLCSMLTSHSERIDYCVCRCFLVWALFYLNISLILYLCICALSGFSIYVMKSTMGGLYTKHGQVSPNILINTFFSRNQIFSLIVFLCIFGSLKNECSAKIKRKIILYNTNSCIFIVKAYHYKPFYSAGN